MNESLDLLDEAVATLRQQLAPKLQGEARYLALLTANAVATARREMSLEGHAHESAPLPSGEAIRSGAHDGDRTIHQQLLGHAVRRAWIADPRSVSEDERREFIDP